MGKSPQSDDTSPDDNSLPSVPEVPLAERKGLLTRSQAAAILGVSVSEVRRRESIGQLHPHQRTANGWVMYTPQEIAKSQEFVTVVPHNHRLTRKSNDLYTPEEASKVFEALGAGKTLKQCVIELRIMPLVVQAISEVYKTLESDGGIFLTKKTVSAINLLPLEGTFPLTDEAGVLEILKTAAADVCKGCNSKARVYCRPCSTKRIHEMRQMEDA